MFVKGWFPWFTRNRTIGSECRTFFFKEIGVSLFKEPAPPKWIRVSFWFTKGVPAHKTPNSWNPRRGDGAMRAGCLQQRQRPCFRGGGLPEPHRQRRAGHPVAACVYFGMWNPQNGFDFPLRFPFVCKQKVPSKKEAPLFGGFLTLFHWVPNLCPVLSHLLSTSTRDFHGSHVVAFRTPESGRLRRFRVERFGGGPV